MHSIGQQESRSIPPTDWRGFEFLHRVPGSPSAGLGWSGPPPLAHVLASFGETAFARGNSLAQLRAPRCKWTRLAEPKLARESGERRLAGRQGFETSGNRFFN